MEEYKKWSVTARHCETTYTIETDSVYVTEEEWLAAIRSLTVLMFGESLAKQTFGD